MDGVRVKRPRLLGVLVAAVAAVMAAACLGLLNLAAARDAVDGAKPTPTASAG